MSSDPSDSARPKRRKSAFGLWLFLLVLATVGAGTTTGLAANGNPGHAPNQNHGGTQQGQQYETPNGGRGIPGCGPSNSQPKKCPPAQQTPTTAAPQPGTPGAQGPAGPQGPAGTNAPAQNVLGER